MKFVRYNLWKAKRAMSPGRAFRVSLWNNLDSAWRAKQLPKYGWYQTHLFRFASALISVVLAAGSFTTGAYAYVNPEITEGSALYPVKRAIEKVEEKLQVTSEAKAKFLLKKISRREAEQAVMERRREKSEKAEIQILEAEDKLEKLEIKIKDDADSGRLRKRIDERLLQAKERAGKRVKKLEEKQKRLIDDSFSASNTPKRFKKKAD